MESPLRPKPDYGENPHNMSTDWWHDASVDSTVSPEEMEFFDELKGVSKKGFNSSFLMTPEGNESPTIMAHDVHLDAHQDSQYQGLNRDNLTPFGGLGQLVVKKGFLDETTQALKKVQDDAAKATKALQETAKQTPGASTSTPPAAPTTTTPKPAPAAPAPPAATTTPQAAAPKPSGTTYTSSTSMSGRAHNSWFQSNPYMQYNTPSPMNPAGQYNDMNYNPRPSYFEEGTGDSSFQNLHTSPNGNYSRESLTFGGVTDLLTVPPADPRWVQTDPDFDEFLPMTGAAEADKKTAALLGMLDDQILHAAKSLSPEDNPYIRDYSETRPLNNNLNSVNAPDMDPNDPADMEEIAETLHQTQPRIRGVGQQGPNQEFQPTNKGLVAPTNPLDKTVDTFSVTVPPSADGTKYSIPGRKENRPVSGMEAMDFIKDH